MIATENVAKTKWCPHARLRDAGDCATNRNVRGEGRQEARCLASGCMAWKWASGFSPDELQSRKSYNPNPDVPKGYCGA